MKHQELSRKLAEEALKAKLESGEVVEKSTVNSLCEQAKEGSGLSLVRSLPCFGLARVAGFNCHRNQRRRSWEDLTGLLSCSVAE